MENLIKKELESSQMSQLTFNDSGLFRFIRLRIIVGHPLHDHLLLLLLLHTFHFYIQLISFSILKQEKANKITRYSEFEQILNHDCLLKKHTH